MHFGFIAEILDIVLFAVYYHFQLPEPLPAASLKQLKPLPNSAKVLPLSVKRR